MGQVNRWVFPEYGWLINYFDGEADQQTLNLEKVSVH